jgi:hypothetical protein
MNTRGATDVENYRRRGWKISAQDVLGTIPLQFSTIAKQPLGLVNLPIVIEHLSGKCRNAQGTGILGCRTINMSWIGHIGNACSCKVRANGVVDNYGRIIATNSTDTGDA